MSATDDLLNEIFEGRKPPLYSEFAAWVRQSRRFKSFVTRYHSKIRAKLKSARDEAGVKDVRAELQTAALLLREERFTLEYEAYAASRQRGPDFTVVFKTHTRFNVEVRRVRGVELDDDADSRAGKLMAVLCDKVGQMPPSLVNLLWLTADGDLPEEELAQAAGALRLLAEGKVEDYFRRRGFENATDFLRQYQKLSGIVLHTPQGLAVWLNPLVRHKAPPDVVAAIRRLGGV